MILDVIKVINYSFVFLELSSKVTTRNLSVRENQNGFCVNGRLLPSLFVIGIQKCGTTTLDGILSKFDKLSHGDMKEHHFFDHKNVTDAKYISQFPKCRQNSQNIVRTYEATPEYTDLSTHSAENIKSFYIKHGIPLNKIVFLAMVCPNSRRIPSYFYFCRKKGYLNPNIKEFNKWFDWMLEHPEWMLDDTHDILRRGFYDEIFAKYFELFPENKFLFVDSQYAFDKMQKLGDFLAKELNLSKRQIPYIHKNVGTARKEELTDFNQKRLNQFYFKHERNFSDIVKTYKNAKTFPTNNFLDEWK